VITNKQLARTPPLKQHPFNKPDPQETAGLRYQPTASLLDIRSLLLFEDIMDSRATAAVASMLQALSSHTAATHP
jgi:hypothetical protein